MGGRPDVRFQEQPPNRRTSCMGAKAPLRGAECSVPRITRSVVRRPRGVGTQKFNQTETLPVCRGHGRLGVPLDIAKGIVFLASDDAGYMNGAGLVVDGGYLAA